MRALMSIREIRKVLYYTENRVLVNKVELVNEQARIFFYGFENQDKLLEVNTYGTIMIIQLVD